MSSESETDLRKRGPVRIILVIVAIAVLATGAYVVFRLATEDRTSVACDHLDDLAKTDPRASDAVDALVGYVNSHVVRMTLSDKEKVTVGGNTMHSRCTAALETLDKALGHGAFTRIRDCLAQALSARAAARCF